MSNFKALFLVILLAAPVLAAEKPKLTVCVRIAEYNYRKYFTSIELDSIQQMAARRVNSMLTKQFGCFEFGVGASRDTLMITLGDPAPPSQRSAIHEVGLTMVLRGPHVAPRQQPLYWVFRSKDEVIPLTIPEALANDLVEFLTRTLQSKKEIFTADVLGDFTIADTVLALRSRVLWVIPFTKESLALDDESVFTVFCEFDESDVRRREQYDASAKGTYNSHAAGPRFFKGIVAQTLPHEKLDLVKSNTPMAILGLRLKRYVQFLESISSISPDSALSGLR